MEYTLDDLFFTHTWSLLGLGLPHKAGSASTRPSWRAKTTRQLGLGLPHKASSSLYSANLACKNHAPALELPNNTGLVKHMLFFLIFISLNSKLLF